MSPRPRFRLSRRDRELLGLATEPSAFADGYRLRSTDPDGALDYTFGHGSAPNVEALHLRRRGSDRWVRVRWLPRSPVPDSAPPEVSAFELAREPRHWYGGALTDEHGLLIDLRLLTRGWLLEGKPAPRKASAWRRRVVAMVAEARRART